MITTPDWAFEFHGHRCPFMPLGYHMGITAMQKLDVAHEKDHGLFVIPELGIGHPQTCLMDGLQIATGATYGKSLMERTYWGKLAAVFYRPGKGAIRFSLRSEFLDAFDGVEFFAYRRRGIEPSQIPAEVTAQALEWIDSQTDEQIFKVETLGEYAYSPPKGSFSRVKCSRCGEYVFERYVRVVQGEPCCIPCSGYQRRATSLRHSGEAGAQGQ